MNICIFAKSLPTHIVGGMELHTQALVEGLIERGHKVVVITTRHPKGIKKEEKGNLKIYYVGDKPLKYTRKFYKESAYLFEKLNRKGRFDVAHSQSAAGVGYVLYGKSFVPLVVTFHGTLETEVDSIYNQGDLKSKMRALIVLTKGKMYYHIFNHKLFFRKLSKAIVVSNQLKIKVIKEYNIPDYKISVIPNGVDVTKFKPMKVDDLREKWNLSDEKVIVSVGAITKQKGFHLLIRILSNILKEIDNIKLFIVGTGPYLQNLKDMAVKLNISNNIVFTGRVSEDDLIKYYNLADVFAFPTLRWEGLPYVVIEVMACRKPVVASRIGGIPTVIEHGKDGFLIKPNDLKDLKEKILMLLEDKTLAKRLGRNARKKVVKKFSLDKMVKNTIKVYEGVLE